ncbi:hypothetical protein [Carnobacterium divergens]|uniref:hypothetical protein n=1 Tax=Carnobacterium divergens TaxID=2748 RepID=UPI0010729A1C|nr:hypothetical protein [Carnobacterium divergens]TFI74741.1 hypothetical protein CKN81_04090 [Carnobacterium divergens]
MNKKNLLLLLSIMVVTLSMPAVQTNAAELLTSIADKKEGFISFDKDGTIINSSLPVKKESINTRVAQNLSGGRWVYYSNLANWGTQKIGNSNYINYTRYHGSKAKVGSKVGIASAGANSYSYASAKGNSRDTFSCWYNPNGGY